MDILKNVEIIRTITRRDFSEILLVRNAGVEYCLKILRPDNRWKMGDIRRSYEIYDSLKDKTGLVKVIAHGRQENTPDSYHILMEYLEGYTRLEFNNFTSRLPAMQSIEDCLMRQGVIQLDMVPINFMAKGKEIVMIDLDKLYKLPDMFYPPPGPTQEFTWYGYAVARTRLWSMNQGRVWRQ